MYLLLRHLSTPRLALQQLLAIAPAWMVAELFYKFHSFTLESAAFLATWLLFDALITSVTAATSRMVHDHTT